MANQHRTGSVSRRKVLQSGGMLLTTGSVFAPAVLRAAAPTIRFANGGAIAPNEVETLMTVEFFQKNVLKHYGKDYEMQSTFTR